MTTEITNTDVIRFRAELISNLGSKGYAHTLNLDDVWRNANVQKFYYAPPQNRNYQIIVRSTEATDGANMYDIRLSEAGITIASLNVPDEANQPGNDVTRGGVALPVKAEAIGWDNPQALLAKIPQAGRVLVAPGAPAPVIP